MFQETPTLGLVTGKIAGGEQLAHHLGLSWGEMVEVGFMSRTHMPACSYQTRLPHTVPARHT